MGELSLLSARLLSTRDGRPQTQQAGVTKRLLDAQSKTHEAYLDQLERLGNALNVELMEEAPQQPPISRPAEEPLLVADKKEPKASKWTTAMAVDPRE